jgi:purine-nucleoside phosphorylase
MIIVMDFPLHDLVGLRNRATDAIRKHSNIQASIAIILGSGLGELANEIDIDAAIDYADIPGFVGSTAPGHSGRLLLGSLAGKKVVAMQGRSHLYEGLTAAQVAFPVRVMHALGAHSLIVSNACGGLNTTFQAGDLMLQVDFINMTSDNALIGPNDPALGSRFPVMFDCYDATYLKLARKVAQDQGITLREGVYLAFSGPTYATRAELRFYQRMGVDAVGMSTVHEVAVARHEGMRVLGISSVTDLAQPDSHEHATGDDVVAMAKQIGPRFRALVKGVLADMPD